jgi:hypothetical protein
VNGVVLQFDSAKATVAIQGKGSVSRDSIVSVLDTKSFFKMKALKINSDPSECVSKMKTHVPVVDMLLGPRLLAGQTIGIYSSSFFHPASGSLRFPSSPEVSKSSFQLYQDLFEVANKAIAQTAFGDAHLVADFRNFEVACSSLEFQARHALPVSPQSLVAAVLQLSHRTRKAALSVTAIFNSKSDFKGESAQNVDISIELAGDNETVSNLESLLIQRACFACSKPSSSLSREDDLIRHLVEGFRAKSEIYYKKKAGVFVDFWEAEQIDSFDTLLRLLSPVSKLYATCSERDKNILMKALTLLHFNKSSERNSSAVSRFPQELLNTLSKVGDPETIDIDSSTIMQHRFEWELTNEVVA